MVKCYKRPSKEATDTLCKLKETSYHSAYLCKEALLELGQELKVQQVVGCESLLTDDRLHGGGVLTDSVVGVHLV